MAHKALKVLGVDSDTVDAYRFKHEIHELLAGRKCSLVCELELAGKPAQDWAAGTGPPPSVPARGSGPIGSYLLGFEAGNIGARSVKLSGCDAV